MYLRAGTHLFFSIGEELGGYIYTCSATLHIGEKHRPVLPC
jgi:hypothetical protein